MDFAKVIKTLLITNDKLYLPGLGTFVTRYKPAEAVPGMNYLKPPSKDIRFDIQLQENDGLLVEYVARHEKISTEEAHKLVLTLIDNINERIHNDRKFGILDIGSFSLVNNKVVFESEVKINLLADAYGLPDVSTTGNVAKTDVPPVKVMEEKKAVTPKKTEPAAIPVKENVKAAAKATIPEPKTKPAKEKSGNGKWIIIGISVPVVAAAIFLFLILPTTGFFESMNEGNGAVVVSNEKVEEEATNEVSQYIDTLTDQSTALMYSDEQVKKETEAVVEDKYAHCKDFYIIAGSFKTQKLANKHRKKLIAQGFKAEILHSDSNYRVYIKHFKVRSEALTELENLQSSNMSVWLLSI